MSASEIVAGNAAHKPRRSLKNLIGTAGLAAAIAIGGASAAGIADVISPPSAAAQETATSLSVAEVAEAANPAVVTVTNLQEGVVGSPGMRLPWEEQLPTNPDDGAIRPVGTGSGFIIDEEGHVVTNSHVVDGGDEFEVTFFDGTTAEAELVGADPYQDVAVLRIVLSEGQEVPGVLSFADSDNVKPGDEVVAIGNPYGEYANTVTSGIINGVERGLDTGIGYSLPNLLQHDAAIYPGNSGGPLLNMEGEVVGMNVAKAFSQLQGPVFSEGLNFAIDSNAIQEIATELIADGNYERAFLGIQAQTTAQGIGVVDVQADSPAAEAGLEVGDLIVGIDGEEIDEPNEGLDILLFDRRPGQVVELEVERDGETITLELTLGERPEVVTQ